MKPQITRTFVISPSALLDPKQKSTFYEADGKTEKENVNVYTDASVESLMDIIDELKQTFKDYKQSKEMVKAFEKWRKNNYDDERLSPKELIYLHRCDFNPDNIPYKSKTKPNSLLILDDIIDTPLSKSKLLSNLVCRLRHLGCNMMVLLQSFKGVPPVIRRNCTHFCVFKTGNKPMLQQVFDEVNQHFDSYEHFDRIFRHATSESKHDSLYIDNTDGLAPIRKNFDTPLQPQDFMVDIQEGEN